MTTPEFSVKSGSPTTEELAVVVALLSSIGGVRELNEPAKLNKWGDPISHMRHRLAVGNRAWRLSAWARH